PGCTSVSDDDETDDCPTGPGCPACSNGVDDDHDQATDYPADLGCTSAAATTEAECAREPDRAGVVTAPVTMGTTPGATDTFAPSCRSRSNADVMYFLTLPVPVESLTIDTLTTSFDTVLAVMDVNCGSELACNDDADLDNGVLQSSVTMTQVAAGSYA